MQLVGQDGVVGGLPGPALVIDHAALLVLVISLLELEQPVPEERKQYYTVRGNGIIT